MFVAASFLTINREYIPGLGEEVYDTQTKKTYKGDGYTKVKDLPPLDTGGGGGPVDVIASDVDYDNANSGMAATNVQAALDETHEYVSSVDAELGSHLLDPTGAHTADAISYNPALANEVTSINVQGAIDQHLLDTTAHSATKIPFTPTPTIVANNTQAAIAEVDAKVEAIEAGGVIEASDVVYSNVISGLVAVNVQTALDEINTKAVVGLNNHLVDALEAHTASAIKYVNSGLILDAFDVQDALDTLAPIVNNHLIDATDAHVASAIGFTPVGTIAATNVQAAIAELAAETVPTDEVFIGTSDPGAGYELWYDIDDPGVSFPNMPLIETAIYIPNLGSMVIGTGGTNYARYVFIGPTGVGAIGQMQIAGQIGFGSAGQVFPEADLIGLPAGFNFTTPPVGAGLSPVGNCVIYDFTGAVYPAFVHIRSATSFSFGVINTAGTYSNYNLLSHAAARPITFAVSDIINWVISAPMVRV